MQATDFSPIAPVYSAGCSATNVVKAAYYTVEYDTAGT